MSEIKTFISESSSNIEKLWSILNATPGLLQIFFQKGFYNLMLVDPALHKKKYEYKNGKQN